MQGNLLILYGMLFVLSLFVVDTVLRALFARGRAGREVQNRLQQIKSKEGDATAYTALLKMRGLARRGGDQTVGNFYRLFMGQTGLESSLPRVLAYAAGLIVLSMFLGSFFFGLSDWLAVVFGVIAGPCLGGIILMRIRKRRITRFAFQMPDAIDVIVRSLNAGHPLSTAIKLVSREMPDPIGSEFGILSDQMTFGADLEQAMLSMYDRVGAQEIKLLTVSVSVQRGTGGKLAEVLENLAQMIRDRFMLKRKIRAISAEGRFTSWIMLGFPFFLYFLLVKLVPDYFEPVWETGYGAYFVVGCLAGIFIGMVIIRKLVNFDF